MKKLPPKSLIEHCLELEKELKEATRLEFDTYDKAIEEIVLLRKQCKNLQLSISSAKNNKKKGRPKKQKSVLLQLMQPENKKKGGRPVEYRDKENRIRIWDAEREKEAKKLGKKSITDLHLLEILIKKNCSTMNRAEKNSLKKKMRTGIKYLRDKTGIRIHKRKKAENPLKK